MSVLIYILSAMIINAGELYGYYNISGEKIIFNRPRLYLVYCFQTVLIILNYTFVSNAIKAIITFLIITFMCKILFKHKKLIDCIIIAFVTEFFMIVSEFIYMFIMGSFNKVNNNFLMETFGGTLQTNIFILILFLVFILLKIPSKLYKKLIKYVYNISSNKLIVFFGLIILISNLIFYISYYNKNNYFTLFVNLSVTVIYSLIMLLLVIKESKYNNIHSKYITTLKELEEYENIINEYRIINHENQNQLNSIKGMTNNKKVHEYIDEILDNKNTKNEVILKQALLIPAGGLRGLIYSKLILMRNKNINYSLHVDKQINSKLIKTISTKTMLNICQIVGVYLDNAIEAVENLNQKNILINIYKLDDMVIEIINNIDDCVDIDKIDKVGYTTKEGIHGYGLSLVNKILKEDNNLTNERNITKSSFKQKLLIRQ